MAWLLSMSSPAAHSHHRQGSNWGQTSATTQQANANSAIVGASSHNCLCLVFIVRDVNCIRNHNFVNVK
jgi:hypothetical protein